MQNAYAWYTGTPYVDVRLGAQIAPVPYILVPAHPLHCGRRVPMVEVASNEPASPDISKQRPAVPDFSQPAPPTLVAVDTNSLSCQWKPLEQHNPEQAELPTWPVAYVLEMQLVRSAAALESSVGGCQSIARCTPWHRLPVLESHLGAAARLSPD